MEKDLESMIFDYKKRQAMRNHPVFIEVKKQWDFDSKDTGNLDYLMKQVHENKVSEDENAIVKQYEWIKFYFSSGLKRKQEEETYQTQQYFGRTLEELYNLSLILLKKVNDSGFNINEQAALNIVYIKVIDDTYNEYMRCFNVIFQMQKQYPEFTFELMKPLESIEYGLDIFVKSANTPVCAIKVLSRSEIDKDKSLYNQKHEVFKMIYAIDTYFIHSSVSGEITGELPAL
jgi:hypothetical protein